MSDPDDPAHRSLYDPRPNEVAIREADEVEDDDGMMEIRMPIASSGAVRNDGDDPLTSAELHGMAQQVDSLTRGVFPEHGKGDMIEFGQYSQFEKLGYWAAADLQSEASDDGEDLLMATARMPDPETLPAATGDYREALAILKEQAKRGIPISASIGWKDDQDAPGGNDLMEASIVGIGADPRTSTEGGTEAIARAAVEAGADPDDLVARVRAAVEPDSEQDSQMPDDDTGEDAGTAEEEQNDEPDDERAPEDVGPADFAEFVASHYDGVDAADVTDALDGAGGDYVGGVDVPELAALIADVTDTDTGTAQDALDELMGGGDEDGEENEGGDTDEEEEEDDEDEQAADGADGERDAAPEDGDERGVEELHERMDAFEEDLDAIRNGDLGAEDIDHPEADTDEEQDADTDDESDDTEREAESPTQGLGDYR